MINILTIKGLTLIYKLCLCDGLCFHIFKDICLIIASVMLLECQSNAYGVWNGAAVQWLLANCWNLSQSAQQGKPGDKSADNRNRRQNIFLNEKEFGT